MSRNWWFAGIVGMLLCAAGAETSQADTLYVSFACDATCGDMSATDLAFTVSGSPGDYIASAIAGNVNVGISNAGFDNINAGSYAVTLLGVGLYLGNDNELLYPDTPYLTGGGFSFTLLGLPGFFQVYSGSTNGSLYSIEFSSSVFIRDGMSSFSVSETPTATPLPSTWLMLLGGLVGLGFIAHRRSKQGTAVTATA